MPYIFFLNWQAFKQWDIWFALLIMGLKNKGKTQISFAFQVPCKNYQCTRDKDYVYYLIKVTTSFTKC